MVANASATSSNVALPDGSAVMVHGRHQLLKGIREPPLSSNGSMNRSLDVITTDGR
jgi:hypothetical protein